MFYFSGFRKKKDDKWQILFFLSLLTIFFIGKSIIHSGHLLFCVVCFVLGIIAYYIFEFIQKKMAVKPASLGKIYSKKYPIIVQYNPPKGINPAEAGLLYNRSVEPTDLTSLIYQWKFEKLIDIKIFKGENSKKEFVKLIKLEDIPFTRPLFECEIFDSIFRMSDIKIIEGAFQLRYALMLEDLEYHGIQKGRLTYGLHANKKNSCVKIEDEGNISVKLFVLWLYFIVLLLSFFIESLNDNIFISFSEFLWGSVIIFCIIFGVILFYGKNSGMSKLEYTDKGAELASVVIGYSQFIKSCDENKIRLLLQEDPLFIDRTLPYATAFGMETEFLKKISPLKYDWNAKYVRGTRVPSWVGILRFLVKDEGSWF